jgi:hypothetical protein
MMGLLLGAALAASPVKLDRVDLLSEDTGTFLNYELGAAGTYPTKTAVRFVTQVKPVLEVPAWEGWTLGISLSSQSVVYEKPLSVRNLYWTGGIQSALFLPRGALVGVAYRPGRWRFGLSCSAVSGATWARPAGYGQWTVLPSLGIGVGGKP